eukprot:2233823-Pyramimonas_sp.AAC.1
MPTPTPTPTPTTTTAMATTTTTATTTSSSPSSLLLVRGRFWRFSLPRLSAARELGHDGPWERSRDRCWTEFGVS